MCKCAVGFLVCFLFCGALGYAGEMPGGQHMVIRQVARPDDDVAERRARPQPAVPDGFRETHFIETAPKPQLEPAEQARGYMLFQRPIMDPVYPNSRPLVEERLKGLVAFATPGEFEPLTFSVYPVRDLVNMKVRASALRGPGGATIPGRNLQVRLLTYWNMRYPRYTSPDTYRRVPELLETVTVHSSPALECQRWWITVRVPETAAPGLYRGEVTVWDDGFDEAIEIPIALRVLPFALKSDPAKRYSSYYYVRNRAQYAGKDEEFIHMATGNEYKTMVDYGLDMLPTTTLRINEDATAVTLPYPEEVERMMAAGMRGPLPVTADSAIARIYTMTTPGGTRGSHWQISVMPPEEFYERVTAAFAALEAERRAKGWPEIVACPIDEVNPAATDFGVGVYRAVKAAGIRTYATKNPTRPEAQAYMPYVDVWCSQPYSIPYESIVSQDRYEYWSYPNHNAGENKDRVMLSKGGRMTYGYGFWRSGYTTLIPWNWNWVTGQDQFNYLRGRQSGCGNRIGDDGEAIPAVYWECFREGKDDARYIYTLQQAIWEREGSANEECRRLVAEGKAILQDTWDAINVQQRYLAEGMWPSREFNARRWRIAMAIEALLEHSPVRQGQAPSVLVDTAAPAAAADGVPPIDHTLQDASVSIKDLGGNFSAWRSGAKEGTVEVTREAGRDGLKGLRWHVTVDHLNDGEFGGQYPIGWPQVARDFPAGEVDMSKYDYLEFLVRVNSDRDEVSDDSTPLGTVINSHAPAGRIFERTQELTEGERIWIPVRFAVEELIAGAERGVEPWQSISQVRLFISERNFRHGTNLIFDIAAVRLLAFQSPVITAVDVPGVVMLPSDHLQVSLLVAGDRDVTAGSHRLIISAVDAEGTTRASFERDLAEGRTAMLDTSRLAPGRYMLNVAIVTPGGQTLSEITKSMECIPGPLWPS